MTRSFLLIGACAGLLAGCATVPPLVSPIRICAEPNKLFVFRELVAAPQTDAIAVSGRVVRKRRGFGMPTGHLHIEAMSAGVVLAWTDTRLGRLGFRARASSRFTATLPVAAARVDEVRVAYLPQGHGDQRKSGIPS